MSENTKLGHPLERNELHKMATDRSEILTSQHGQTAVGQEGDPPSIQTGPDASWRLLSAVRGIVADQRHGAKSLIEWVPI